MSEIFDENFIYYFKPTQIRILKFFKQYVDSDLKFSSERLIELIGVSHTTLLYNMKDLIKIKFINTSKSYTGKRGRAIKLYYITELGSKFVKNVNLDSFFNNNISKNKKERIKNYFKVNRSACNKLLVNVIEYSKNVNLGKKSEIEYKYKNKEIDPNYIIDSDGNMVEIFNFNEIYLHTKMNRGNYDFVEILDESNDKIPNKKYVKEDINYIKFKKNIKELYKDRYMVRECNICKTQNKKCQYGYPEICNGCKEPLTSYTTKWVK